MGTTLFFDSKAGFGQSENFETAFSPPLELERDRDYEISLVSATMWHSWRNITSANNKFVYRVGGDPAPWKTLEISPGAYNLPDINKAVKEMMKDNGDFDNTDKSHQKYYISIEGNYNTLHSRIVLNNHYEVDFTGVGTIREILGFSSIKLQRDGKHVSERVVNITDVESLHINCSLITNSYVNGKNSSVLYSLSPNVPPGYLIQVKPPQLIQMKISKRGLVDSVRFFVTNQSGKLIDMNNERVTYFLYLNELK